MVDYVMLSYAIIIIYYTYTFNMNYVLRIIIKNKYMWNETSFNLIKQ